MAKKDRLKNLIGAITESIIQDEPREQPREEREASADGQENRVPSELIEELGISPEMEAQLNELRRGKPGRPKGRESGNPNPRENRATFIIDRDLTRKLKYIALMETRLYKDVVSEALRSFVEGWESENGTINLPKK